MLGNRFFHCKLGDVFIIVKMSAFESKLESAVVNCMSCIKHKGGLLGNE